MAITTRLRLYLRAWGPSRLGARLMGGRVCRRNSLCWWLSEDFGHWLTFEVLLLPGVFASLAAGELLGHALFPLTVTGMGKLLLSGGPKPCGGTSTAPLLACACLNPCLMSFSSSSAFRRAASVTPRAQGTRPLHSCGCSTACSATACQHS